MDATLEQVKPLPGWVILEEMFEQDREVQVGDMKLAIARLNVMNTIQAVVLAVPDPCSLELAVGDTVIYREWEGGRWSLDGRVVLLMAERHILAKAVIG